MTRKFIRAGSHGIHLARRARIALRRRTRPIAGTIRRAPIPGKLRQTLYRYLPWQPWTVEIPINRLLIGAQNSLTAAEITGLTGDLLWASRPVAEGPHADLLRRAEQARLTDQEILSSWYAEFARAMIQHTGNFFSARDDEGILLVARAFLEDRPRDADEPATTGHSIAGSSMRVARISGSDCYQVIDGHHRVARLAVQGAETVRARPGWLRTRTPLQETLDSMSWIGGQRELYQPLPSPELEKSWTVVRKCTDRLDKMHRLLKSLDHLPDHASYLDVASCYGWFVAQMAEAGLDAFGVERDPLGKVVGEAVYGLNPDRIAVGTAEDFLSQTDRKWDVVSCLSLLHHFALGRASVPVGEFLGLLDQATNHVLFLDTGQANEEWFADRLPDWTPDHIAHMLETETSFDLVVDLGADEDAVGSYTHNYQRHLFACVRHPRP